MVYVISHEIIPDTHRHGNERQATIGLVIGLALMMFLDVAFGQDRGPRPLLPFSRKR